jgi:hypothetical protein
VGTLEPTLEKLKELNTMHQQIDNVDEMRTFLKTYKLPKLTQDEIENQKISIDLQLVRRLNQ